MTRIVIALTMLLTAAPAIAETPCVRRDEVIRELSSKFSENPVAMGMASNGAVVEVFSSRTGDTWTILLTMPNGMSCLIASGEAWEAVPNALSGPQV